MSTDRGEHADVSPSVVLALRLTALELLLRPMGPWAVRPLIIGLAALALLSPKVLSRPATWLALAVLVGLRIASDWPLSDNHIYLLGYWCLAVGLALGAARTHATLAESARWLLGCAFLLAVLWKGVLAPEFVDSRFFRVTLLTDPRFEDVVRLTGLRPEDLAANREALTPLPGGGQLTEPPDVVEPPALRALAATLTWGGLIVESAIALACLAPPVALVPRLRHVLLLAFCATTYAIAPVAGFGWLILAMGVSMCGPSDRWLRRAYVGMWLLVLVYSEVPWAGVLVRWIG